MSMSPRIRQGSPKHADPDSTGLGWRFCISNIAKWCWWCWSLTILEVARPQTDQFTKWAESGQKWSFQWTGGMYWVSLCPGSVREHRALFLIASLVGVSPDRRQGVSRCHGRKSNSCSCSPHHLQQRTIVPCLQLGYHYSNSEMERKE